MPWRVKRLRRPSIEWQGTRASQRPAEAAAIPSPADRSVASGSAITTKATAAPDGRVRGSRGFPALAESRNHVLRLFESGQPSTAELVEAIEGDVALSVTVLRLANQVDGRARGRIESVVKAVQVLSPRGVRTIASRARTFDFFQPSPMWKGMPERFRLHAIATQRAANRLARSSLRGQRPVDGHLAAARHRQARAGPGVPGIPASGSWRRAHARGAAAGRKARAGRRSCPRWRRTRTPVEPAPRVRQRDRAPPRR